MSSTDSRIGSEPLKLLALIMDSWRRGRALTEKEAANRMSRQQYLITGWLLDLVGRGLVSRLTCGSSEGYAPRCKFISVDKL